MSRRRFHPSVYRLSAVTSNRDPEDKSPSHPRRARLGRLKDEYGLAPLRVRGVDRVALHADLVMLAGLVVALARA
jgi:hypothetical protein